MNRRYPDVKPSEDGFPETRYLHHADPGMLFVGMQVYSVWPGGRLGQSGAVTAIEDAGTDDPVIEVSYKSSLGPGVAGNRERLRMSKADHIKISLEQPARPAAPAPEADPDEAPVPGLR